MRLSRFLCLEPLSRYLSVNIGVEEVTCISLKINYKKTNTAQNQLKNVFERRMSLLFRGLDKNSGFSKEFCVFQKDL